MSSVVARALDCPAFSCSLEAETRLVVRPKSVMSWLKVKPAPACSSSVDAVSEPAPMRDAFVGFDRRDRAVEAGQFRGSGLAVDLVLCQTQQTPHADLRIVLDGQLFGLRSCQTDCAGWHCHRRRLRIDRRSGLRSALRKTRAERYSGLRKHPNLLWILRSLWHGSGRQVLNRGRFVGSRLRKTSLRGNETQR